MVEVNNTVVYGNRDRHDIMAQAEIDFYYREVGIIRKLIVDADGDIALAEEEMDNECPHEAMLKLSNAVSLLKAADSRVDYLENRYDKERHLRALIARSAERAADVKQAALTQKRRRLHR